MIFKRALQVSAIALVGAALMAWVAFQPARFVPAFVLTPWSRMQATCAAWFMHLWGMHVWADDTSIWTDLYAYSIPAGYHGIGIAVAAVLAAIATSIWRRYHGIAGLFMVCSSLLIAIAGNVIRVALLIRFGPSPASSAMEELLRDSMIMLAILMTISVWVNMIIIDAARHIKTQKDPPIPGTQTGALSEFPPFWHRVLRRHRLVYLVIPAILIGGATLYLGRTARRLTIWTQLVRDLSEQGHYEPALQLGRKVSVLRDHDTEWQLQLIRIKLLAGQPQAAHRALDHLAQITGPADHIAERTLLYVYVYAYVLQQDYDDVIRAMEALVPFINEDPIWNIILLELAMYQANQAKIMQYAPLAARSDTQRERMLPALPVLESSGNWQTLLASSRWIDLDTMDPESLKMQILAQLQLNRTSDAAERIQRMLQHDVVDLDIVSAALMLTHLSPTDWEPRLAHMLRRAIIKNADKPESLAHIADASFAAHRPEFAWLAYRRLRERDPNCLYADLILVRHADEWFRVRRHALRLPAATAQATTDLLPFALLGRHIPFFQQTISRIPHTGDDALLLQHAPWMQHRVQAVREQLEEIPPDTLAQTPQLALYYVDILTRAGDVSLADRQLAALAGKNPSFAAFAFFQRASLASQQEDHWQSYRLLRQTLSTEEPLPLETLLNAPVDAPVIAVEFRQHTAHQLPLIMQLVVSQWETGQYVAALSTVREGLRRFPDNSPLRTIKADMLLQWHQPEQALTILENTTIRRSRETDLLEAEALRATGRFSVLPAFRRQRMLPPEPARASVSPPDRLLPAEAVLTPMQPEELHVRPPDPGSHFYAAYHALSDTPDNSPDFARWLTNAETRLEQAEAMYVLACTLHAQNRTALAERAALKAVRANPHEPLLWQLLLKSTREHERWIKKARSFCPEDPNLWLAELVWQAQRLPRQDLSRALQHSIRNAQEIESLPVETLVRAADFLWRGDFFDDATALINLYRRRERGLLAAHLLGVEAAEHADNPGRALEHIAAAIEAAGDAAPELYARYIMGRLQAGVIDAETNIIQALRNLQRADPDNILWLELLGFARYQRGGADVIEASQKMRRAMQAGSTNRVVYAIAAEGLRRLNRTSDAANILREGLEIHPGDIMLLNNLAFVLAENPATAREALELTNALEPLAAEDPALRETLALVLLRNNDLDAAQELLARNLRESSPDSRIWFRSQMHLSEIVWRQGRQDTAINMIEQLLRGARNIPDEDVLTANRLLLRFRTAH